jgi:hypothetical protein
MYVICKSHIYWLYCEHLSLESTNTSLAVTSPLRQHITIDPNGLQIRTLLSCIHIAFTFTTMYVICKSHIYWLYCVHLNQKFDPPMKTVTYRNPQQSTAFRIIVSPQRNMFISRLIHRYCRLVMFFRIKVYATSNSISIKSSTHQWKQWLIVIHSISNHRISTTKHVHITLDTSLLSSCNYLSNESIFCFLYGTNFCPVCISLCRLVFQSYSAVILYLLNDDVKKTWLWGALSRPQSYLGFFFVPLFVMVA